MLQLKQHFLERTVELVIEERYNMKFALAAVRGYIKRCGKAGIVEQRLLDLPLSELSTDDAMSIIDAAKGLDIKLYHFKNSDRQLPRVTKVLGFLRGIYFESLLDVGSGRGVFLIPFLEEFSHIDTYSVDILEKRVEMLSDLSFGGIDNLNVRMANICEQPYPNKSVDVVTMLEVLEHIPDVAAAIRSAVNMAKKYVVVTVPSKEDDNPEHIHLLTKDALTEYFSKAGATKLSFGGVPGHLFMIAKVDGE